MIFNPQVYRFTPYSIPPLMTAGLCLVSCLYFLGFNRQSRFNRLLDSLHTRHQPGLVH